MYVIKINGRGGIGWVREDRGDLFLTIDRTKAKVYPTELDAKVDQCQIDPGDYEITVEETN